MTDIFIFHGGPYKRELYGRNHAQDDGDYRAPLDCAEAQFVLHDPELPGRDAPNAFGSTFFMQKHVDRPKSQGGIKDLAVDDYVYIHLLPIDSAFISLGVVTDFGIDNFQAQFEIVNACEVYTALANGGTGADVKSMITPMVYDFTKGLGYPVKDAVNMAQFDCRSGDPADFTKYRNISAITRQFFGSWIYTGGNAAYVRMKILEVPANWDNPCTTCNEICRMPRIQVSLMGMVGCLRLHELLPYCNCSSKICAGECEPSC